jgi:hypothetical protein
MFKKGVATAIAKEFGYSWEVTVDFCRRHNLDMIQYYWQTPLPPAADTVFNHDLQRYLHLPALPLSEISSVDFLHTCREYIRTYKSNRLILHHETDDKTAATLEQLETLDCEVGIENHAAANLPGFQSFLQHCRQRRSTGMFIVLDVHKFFNRFCRIHTQQEILDAIRRLFIFCGELNLNLLLHIIDSRSFDAGREFWCPVFDGLVPYRRIFAALEEMKTGCSGLILEYEEEGMAAESIKRLRESGF